jgi:hypothetical protein
LYFVLTGRYKDFTKFEYSNLEEFINKGINPNLNLRFSDINELKKAFLKIKPK